MEVCTHLPSEATRKALRKLGKHLGRQDPMQSLYFAAVRQDKAPARFPRRGL